MITQSTFDNLMEPGAKAFLIIIEPNAYGVYSKNITLIEKIGLLELVKDQLLHRTVEDHNNLKAEAMDRVGEVEDHEVH